MKCDVHPAEFLPCQVCVEQKAWRDQHVERVARVRRDTIEARLAAIGIGERYRSCSFDNFSPVCPDAAKARDFCQRYALTFADRRREGDCLAMIGNPGTGKNHLSAAICYAVHDLGFSAIHTTVARLLRRIREAYGPRATTTEQAQIDSFVAPDLLVLDELGLQRGTDDELVLLNDVICSRIENLKPVILLSNMTLADFSLLLGDRVVDRLYQGKSRVLVFTWESYRRRVAL